MDLFLFITIAVAYLMMMHMVVGVEKNFTYWLHIPCFVFGWLIGWYMDSYITGLVFGMIFHMLLTSGAFG